MPVRARLDLLRFIPFRLNRLAASFSQALADDYARFGIDIPEWRVLATLGQHDGACSAQYVATCTRTHKSRISRAVAHLVALGLVVRGDSGENGRTVMLTLTRQGRGIYEELVPILLARERTVMACLDEGEMATFERLLGKLEAGFGLMSCADGKAATRLRQAG
jgi:DNA-binding MarR family transcriptional regulator